MLSLILLMTTTQDPPEPVGPLPSANQMAWHARQYYAFVHFGPNTFTGVEWGHGTEDPKVFNPTELDARQWCRTFKEAGMTGVIITAKHHDGFALWQSKYTSHGVMSSKWRDGKGDVLKDLSEACKEYGLWMGVYLSPWDRNHPTYGSELYNDTFVAMLEEVLSNYGDMKEVWFDGANGEGPNGKRQVYDWPRFEATVRKFAPNAVIFHDGGDVRWVGNESGFVGETNWNFLPSGHWAGDQSIYKFLNEGDPKGDKYSPGECDVSIRPGWFWRESENDRVKSLEQLKQIWYRSVGHGGNLLLNVPPDTRGLIHENDARALMEFRRWQNALYAENLAFSARATATSQAPGHGAGAVTGLQGRSGHNWMPQVNDSAPAIALSWNEEKTFDHVVLCEPVSLGQRVSAFRLDVNGTTVARGTTVGYSRMVQFPTVTGKKIRIVIEGSRGVPLLSRVMVYCGDPSVEIVTDSLAFIDSTTATVRSNNPRATIRYTLDGTVPTSSSTKYTGPIKITESCTLRAVALFNGMKSVKSASAAFRKYERSELRHPIIFIRAPDPGLRYRYYEQGWQTLDQFTDAKETSSGVSLNGLDLSHRSRDEHFAFVFDGVISVPEDGIYTFKLTSDDGSRLYIGDDRIIDNDGLHGMETKQGIAPLAAGYHHVRVEYFNAAGGMGLKLEWQGPGVRTGPVPATAFSH